MAPVTRRRPRGGSPDGRSAGLRAALAAKRLDVDVRHFGGDEYVFCGRPDDFKRVLDALPGATTTADLARLAAEVAEGRQHGAHTLYFRWRERGK